LLFGPVWITIAIVRYLCDQGVYWERETLPASKEKALIEWGIMRQTKRQMLACLYNGSARSFTRIPATLKAKFAREFGSQPQSAFHLLWPLLDWERKTEYQWQELNPWFYGTYRCASVREIETQWSCMVL